MSIPRHSLSVLSTGWLRMLVILESNQDWPGVLERVCVSMSCFYLQLDDKKQSQLWWGHWTEGSLGCHRPWGLDSTRIMGAGAMGVEGGHRHPASWWRLWITQSLGHNDTALCSLSLCSAAIQDAQNAGIIYLSTHPVVGQTRDLIIASHISAKLSLHIGKLRLSHPRQTRSQ